MEGAVAFLWLHGLLLVTSGDDPIVTDRPDFTESAVVVGPSKIQVESGVSWSVLDGDRSAQLPEMLLRYGIAPRLEVRFEAPNYIVASGASDWAATAVGLKWQLGPTPAGVDLACLSMLGLPSGSRTHGLRSVEPRLFLCLSKDLDSQHALASMIGVSWPDSGAGRKELWTFTLSLAHAMNAKVSAFMEYAGFFKNGQRPENLMHVGFMFQPKPHMQWDLHAAIRMDRGTQQSLIGLGFSYRF